MVKQFMIQGKIRKPWIIVSILLMLVLIGTTGCSQSQATSTQATSQEQGNQGKSDQGQPAKEQRVRNPATQAAMEIRRLQNNQQNALTNDQKDKLKPILQDLINTSNPSQEFLQQKADAINAVLTDQQKSFLTAPRTANGNNQNQNNQNSNNSNGNSKRDNNSQGGNGGKQPGNSFKPQDIYQQVLDSLK